MTHRRLAERLILVAAFAASASLAAACSSGDETAARKKKSPIAYLTPAEHLARASMALRGMKPSVEEIDRVTNDPKSLEAVVDGYVQSPAFGKIVRDLHNEALLSRVDYYYYPAGFPTVGALEKADIYEVNRSVQEASLRLIEHVVMSDKPYSEIVTADWFYANDIVATVWGNLEMTGSDWQETHWTDQRPRAGILSDPWIFTRFQSTPSNRGRGRANAISKALLCYDFLSRDIEIDASINLADPAVVDNAVVKNPTCASCHQALDPLAAFFRDYFPLYVAGDFTTYPFRQNFEDPSLGTIDFYTPGLGEYYYGKLRDPGYFGQQASSVTELGQRIADDPRFSLCAVERFYAYFHQTGLDDVDLEVAARLQRQFLQNGMSAKQLAKAIVLADDFRVSHTKDAEAAETLVGVLKTRPDQLDSMIEDLTGFRWELDPAVGIGGVNLVADSFIGFQVLGGGIDSAFVTRPAHTFNATSSLMLEALAAEAAAFVIENDAAQHDAQARKIFKLVDPASGTDDQVRDQLAWLHARLFAESVAPGSPEVAETFQLFTSLRDHAGGDSLRAWQGVLAALFQDIRIATY